VHANRLAKNMQPSFVINDELASMKLLRTTGIMKSFIQRVGFYLSLLTIWQFVFLVGCGPDQDPEICSCEGRESKDIEELAVVVDTQDGYVYLSPTSGYYFPCAAIENDLRTDGLLVALSIERKAICTKPDDAYHNQKLSFGLPHEVETHNDSTFNRTDFRISIIRSEDYGYEPGFGYRIELKNGFKILQPFLPAVSGFTPFRTKSDAYKTAILVTHLLNQDVALPSIKIEDLLYLKVL